MTVGANAGGISVETLDKGTSVARANKAYTRAEIRELASSKPASTRERGARIAAALAGEPQPEPAAANPSAKPAEVDTSRRARREEPPAQDPEPELPDAVEPEEAAPAAGADTIQDDSPDADEEVSLETLDDLVEALELDRKAVDALRVKLQVDGEQVEMELGEAIKGTQFAKANTQLRQRITADQRKAEAKMAEQAQALDASFEQAKQYTVAAAAVLQRELNSPQVQALRSDPAGAHQFLQYQAQAEQRMKELGEEYSKIEAEQARARQQSFAKAREAGLTRLRDAIPDFDSPERRAALAKTAAKFGADEAALHSIADDRILMLVHEHGQALERIAELEAAQEEAVKKARKIVKESKSARPKKSAPTGAAATSQQLKIARDAIVGKKGRARTLAVADAINMKLQQAKQRRR